MVNKTPTSVQEECVNLLDSGLSQREVARRLNIWQSTISQNIEQWREDIYKEIGKPSKDDLRQQIKPIDDYVSETKSHKRNVKHIWHKTKLEDWSKVSVFIKNPEEAKEQERFWQELIDEVKKHAPVYPTIERNVVKDPHLLVIDPADIHIGKLCSAFETWEEYNQEIAVQRVREWVQGILDKSAAYNIEKILFIGGNDILHTDNTKRTTTSGTPQDTDGMWYDNYLKAKKLYVEVIETLLAVADVEFIFNPSNHDFMSGFYLCQVVEAHFHNNENITFQTDMRHRKYYMYWKNLIGTTHNDWAKQADLPLIMANEAKVEWSQTEHRYFYWHHLHHKTAKDYHWVTFEWLRSASGTDSWHHRNGFQYAPKAVEWFLHHPYFWQIARFTHLF